MLTGMTNPLFPDAFDVVVNPSTFGSGELVDVTVTALLSGQILTGFDNSSIFVLMSGV